MPGGSGVHADSQLVNSTGASLLLRNNNNTSSCSSLFSSRLSLNLPFNIPSPAGSVLWLPFSNPLPIFSRIVQVS